MSWSVLARVRARVPSWSRRQWVASIAVAVVVLAVVALLSFYVYYGVLGFHAPDDVESSVRENPNVTVERAYGGFVLRPADAASVTGGASTGNATGERVGVIFYPGGRVAPDAYLPSAARIVEETGATVVVPGMTANLAVLSQGKASTVIDGEQGVDRWIVGGHSLGGAMACRYANANPGRVDGVFVVGAYCDRPIEGVPALSVVGTRDAVLDRERFRETRSNLPANATVVRIDGMNHSQAGWYYGQAGGQPATIGYPTAHDRLASTVADWLCRAYGAGPRNASSDGAKTVVDDENAATELVPASRDVPVSVSALIESTSTS